MNRSMKRKAAQTRRNALLVATLMLVVCIASIGGTIAWLTDSTGEVKNTFAPSNIDLALDETLPTNKTANMIPGGTIPKDPKATITNDVDAYLFVTVTESTNPDLDTYIKWEIADGWTLLEKDEAGDYYVYYREVSEGANQEFGILKGDTVSVLTTVTKANMDAIANDKPTLSFKAYAIQQYKFDTAAAAWDELT